MVSKSPWFKIDDGFWSHPKVLELSPEALALWVRAGSYCAGHLTDGQVKASTLRLLGATDWQADELVTNGLWDLDAGGHSWWFHDWEHYQPSASATKEKRAALSVERRKAGAKGAANRWQKDGNSDGKLPSVSHEGVDGKRIAPTRPDPNPSTSTEVDVSVSTERGDVTMLCNLLADLIERNGSKRPTVTKAWMDDARRMLDLDGREPEKAARLIRWSQDDDFWRANILSMPKFREKYDQLRLQAEKPTSSRPAAVTPAERMRQTLALVPVAPDWKELA